MKKIILVCVLIIGMACLTQAADRYVNVNTGTDDLAAGRGDSPGDPWATIQFAINNSNPSDTIHVAAGDYDVSAGSPGLLVNKQLTLLGPQAGVDPRPSKGTTRTPADTLTEAVVDGKGAIATLLEFRESGIEVNGFHFYNGTGDLVESESSYGPFTTDTLRYCIVGPSSGDEGIQFRYQWHSAIENNYIYDTYGDGINVSSGSWDCVVSHNEVEDIRSPDGIFYFYSNYFPLVVSDNYIHDCTGSNGIKVYDNDDWAGAGALVISNNTISGNHFFGSKYVQDGNAIQLYKPFKMANTYSSIEVTSNTIVNNNGNGNDMRQAGHGIYWHQSNSETNDNLPITITYNSIREVQGWGILFEMETTARDLSTTRVHTNHNTFYSNVLGQFSNTSSEYTDASFNYWGQSNGPIPGVDVMGPVVTDPYAYFTPVRRAVGTGGGTVAVDSVMNDLYKNLKLTIPSLSEPATCILKTPADRHGINNAVEITLDPPGALNTDATIKVEFNVPNDHVPGGTWQQMRLAKWSGSSWEIVPDPNKSNWPGENTVEGDVSSFSIYGAYPDPGTVPVEISTFSLE